MPRACAVLAPMDALVFDEVELTAAHLATGDTRHVVGGSRMAPPAKLRIVRYANEPGHYLLCLDEHGVEQTDTYPRITDARHQAALEFAALPHEWTALRSDPGG